MVWTWTEKKALEPLLQIILWFWNLPWDKKKTHTHTHRKKMMRYKNYGIKKKKKTVNCKKNKNGIMSFVCEERQF